MTIASRFVGWALADALLLGCGTPSRHLTTRGVDDPMSLPRRLMAASVSESVDTLGTSGIATSPLALRIRYGLTDKLELDDLSLRFAFLDDAPPAGGAPPETSRKHLSLAVRAGIEGLGFSSTDGFIMLPTLVVDARKHLGARGYVWASAEWSSIWASDAARRIIAYTRYLWPNSSRSSEVSVGGGSVVQVGNHITIGASVGGQDLFACTVPTCDVAAYGLTAAIGPSFRPWRWLALSVSGYGAVRWRTSHLILPTPPNVQAPELPPGRVSWVGVTGTVTFFW
jgi:hypothetical protein